MINSMLTLSGMRKVTLLCIDLIMIFGITMPFLLVVGLIVDLVALPSLGVFPMLFIVFIFITTMNMILLILRYTMSTNAGLITFIAIQFIQFVVSLLSSLADGVSPFIFATTIWIPN